MKHLSYSHQKADLFGRHTVANQLDFFALYDRYAPVLLGVIKKIISDEVESVALLEKNIYESSSGDKRVSARAKARF